MRFILLILLCVTPALYAVAEVEDRWDFSVSLNGREVGSHNFVVREEGGRRFVTSTMRLDFRVFLVKRVIYQHQANEVWQDGCLIEVSSQTERDGKKFTVEANVVDAGLAVISNDGAEMYAGCVRSFAYWEPKWLQGQNLLNVENGKNVPVTISQSVSSDVNKKLITIAAPKGDIYLQYDAQGDWLSLKTKLPIAGELSYQRN